MPLRKKMSLVSLYAATIAVVLGPGVLTVSANVPVIGAISESQRNQDSLGNYNFGYKLHSRDGQQQFRQESRDVLGRVVGTYGLAEPDGRQRVVDYIADHNGFRARVRSNEPGLQGIDSAGVRIVKPEDVPTPLFLPNLMDRIEQSSEAVRVPYNPGGPPMENPSRWGNTGRAFPPLTPDKPYITQSEGLYIPPQAVDDLTFSPSGQRSRGRFESFLEDDADVYQRPSRPGSFQRSERLQDQPSRAAISEEERKERRRLFEEAKIEYPFSVFSLPNADDRYGSRLKKPNRVFKYRVVQIPNGIQAVPEVDPSGVGGPFPSASDLYLDNHRRQPYASGEEVERDAYHVQQQRVRLGQADRRGSSRESDESFYPRSPRPTASDSRSRPRGETDFSRESPRSSSSPIAERRRLDDYSREYGRRISQERA